MIEYYRTSNSMWFVILSVMRIAKERTPALKITYKIRIFALDYKY